MTDGSNPSYQHRVSRQSVRKLVTGQITPAQFLGLTQKQLYQIAQLGYELMNSGKVEEAKRVYEGLIAADPSDSVFHCHLAAAHHRLGELDEAVGHYSEALRFNRANVDALAGRGEIEIRRGRIEQGVHDLAAAVRLDPEAKKASTARARSLLLAVKNAANPRESATGPSAG